MLPLFIASVRFIWKCKIEWLKIAWAQFSDLVESLYCIYSFLWIERSFARTGQPTSQLAASKNYIQSLYISRIHNIYILYTRTSFNRIQTVIIVIRYSFFKKVEKNKPQTPESTQSDIKLHIQSSPTKKA